MTAEDVQRAIEEIDLLTAEIEVDKIYRGIVRGIKEFGCFVECLPGKEGLVHISELADRHVEVPEAVVNVGDQVDVKVIDIDDRVVPVMRLLALLRQLEARLHLRPPLPGPGEQPDKRVDHHVADEADPVGVHALATQVLITVPRRREEQVGDAVGQHTVDLLRHGAVEGAEPRLDVGDADAALHGHERRGEGGVDVADDDDPVRLRLGQHRLEPRHDLRGLHGVGPGAHLEVHVRGGQSELLEEDPGHLLVVVLTGVDEDLLEAAPGLHRLVDGGDLHEVGPGSDHVQ